MSMGESHEHGRTTCAYEGVNGVNLRFFVYFCFRFFVSFLSPSATANSVFFRRSGSPPSSPDHPLDSVRPHNPLTFA
jgi:hypothetical protein